MSTTSDKRIGNESIHVLNDKYQYVSASQATNAKWLDLDNVVSVKRDKTIYAIRARNTFDFENQDDNVEFFCNINGDTGLAVPGHRKGPLGNLLTTNVFRHFGSNLNHIFVGSSDLKVYGNSDEKGLSGNVGWAGSLTKDWNPLEQLPGNINVTTKISVYSNLTVRDYSHLNREQLGGWLYIDGNVKNISTTQTNDNYVNIANHYSSKTLFMSNMENNTTRWNRLINGNVWTLGPATAKLGNTIATASTDPCDLNGNAIGYDGDLVHSILGKGAKANVATNEAYRFQFAVRRNNESVSNENPIYIGRISRFGTRLTDVTGTMSKVMAIDSFSGNFFANLPSDNVIYHNKNKTPTEFSISGNYKSSDYNLFNGNYLDGNIANLNGNSDPKPSKLDDFVSIDKYTTTMFNDYIVGANLQGDAPTYTNGKFTKLDKFTVVQCNLNMSNPWYLYDRLKVNSTSYKKPSEIFSPSNASGALGTDATANDTITNNSGRFIAKALLPQNNNAPTMDSKVVHLSFYNIVANNWQSTAEIQPSTLQTPTLIQAPNPSSYTYGNTISLFLRRGFISLDNFSQISTTVPTTSSRYFTSLPSYIKSYKEPSGGIYIEDKSVTVAPNLAGNCSITEKFDVSDTLQITANICPDLCFYVYANADINNRVDRRANVVITGNTVIGNVWNYDKLNATKLSSVTWDPRISYNTFDGLTVENPYAKKNLTYTIKFGRVLGETNLVEEKASLTQYGFYANLHLEGKVLGANIGFDDITGSSPTLNLTNNNHMNGLLLNGVAYSEFEFTNFSYKFTDLGNVCSINSSNYKYNSVLPIVGNISSKNMQNVNDNYMNILVNYGGTSITGADSDVHRLAIYDNFYRYEISSAQKTGGAPINNSTMYRRDSNSDDVFELISSKGTVSHPVAVDAGTVTIIPAPFLIYTYEKIYENSSADSFYPFVSPSTSWTQRVQDKTDNDNYLFPGFVWKRSNDEAELHNYKDETNADFVIPNNVKDIQQNLSLIIFSADSATKTLKLALSTDNVTKTVNIKPMRIGNNLKTDSNAARLYYTPVVFKISEESNSYVVLLIRIAVDSSGNFTGLDSEYNSNTPVSVNINCIEKSSDNFNQIVFKSKLQVYDSSHALRNEYTNVVQSHKTKISNFSYSSSYGAGNTNVGVNLFSIPTNNIVVLYAFQKQTIRQLMNYTRTDYELDNSFNFDTTTLKYKKINRPVSGLNFSSSKTNTTNNSQNDGNNPPLLPNTTRFYLDSGFAEDVYIDYLNNSTVPLQDMMKFTLNRSVEWILTRQEQGSSVVETIGRGLLSKNPNMTVSALNDYVLSENLGKAKSGFFMNLKTNIVDLASHILAQKKQTGRLKMNTAPQFVFHTKSDEISVSIFQENPSTQAKTFVKNEKVEGTTIDFSKLFPAVDGIDKKYSTLPEIEFDIVRSLYNTRVNTSLPQDALFRLRIRLDNYCLVHNKLPVNDSNVILSSKTGVKSDTLGVALFSDLKRSLNYDFLNISSPINNEFKLIKSFKHLGFGKVDVRIYDFTSHYGNELPNQVIVPVGTSGASVTNETYNPSLDAFKDTNAFNFVNDNSVDATTVDIQYNNDNSKFYINLGTKDQEDRIYFRGTTLQNQPTKLNDLHTALLYTGTRPVGFITYERTGSTGTLQSFRDTKPVTFTDASKLFSSEDGSAFTAGTGSYPSAATYKAYYSIAFTNRNAHQPIQVRGTSYTFTHDDLFKVNVSKNLFGVFRSLSNLLSETKFNFRSENVLQSYNLTPVYLGDRFLTTHSEKTKERYLTYGMKKEGVAGDELFHLKLFGSISQTGDFKVNIEPSQLMLYQAMDVNENGELDTNNASTDHISKMDKYTSGLSPQNIDANFGLNNNFSELLYNLRSNPSNNQSYRSPQIVQTIDLSSSGWNTITGSGLDIKLNKRWAVGYNLDCFFVFRNNNISTFDVISIDTDRQNSSASVASLKVQNSLPLVVGRKNSWARSKGYTEDSNQHCGLTFKVRNDKKITQGDVVRLFVDNTPVSSSVSVNVTVAGRDPKVYRVSDYDNETYSRLLDKQIKVENKFA